MAKRHYKVASEDGQRFVAERHGLSAEVGEEVQLELEHDDQERALVAAGWLEPAKKKESK